MNDEQKLAVYLKQQIKELKRMNEAVKELEEDIEEVKANNPPISEETLAKLKDYFKTEE